MTLYSLEGLFITLTVLISLVGFIYYLGKFVGRDAIYEMHPLDSFPSIIFLYILPFSCPDFLILSHLELERFFDPTIFISEYPRLGFALIGLFYIALGGIFIFSLCGIFLMMGLFVILALPTLAIKKCYKVIKQQDNE